MTPLTPALSPCKAERVLMAYAPQPLLVGYFPSTWMLSSLSPYTHGERAGVRGLAKDL